MPRPIDHRSASPHPADRVYAVMADPEYLRARLARIGGKGAELLEHSPEGDGVRYRLRQGLAKEDLPAVVGKVVSGDLAIERTETLNRNGAGDYSGDVDVKIPGAPASASGSMRLADAADGALFEVHTDVSVNVPLFGGKIEEIVAAQVRRLLEAETAFTISWLGAH
jgi:Protein of unknown function (DUF2505)